MDGPINLHRIVSKDFEMVLVASFCGAPVELDYFLQQV